MKLTNRLLKVLIAEESKKIEPMLLLRKQIREGIRKALQEDGAPAKPGAETSDAKGNLDVKKLANALDIDDPAKLKTAVADLRAGKRTSADDKIFGDFVAKLIDADANKTTVAMNVMKKVSDDVNNQKGKAK